MNLRLSVVARKVTDMMPIHLYTVVSSGLVPNQSLKGFTRGAGAGPAGTAAAGPMLEAKLMNLIKGWLQKF